MMAQDEKKSKRSRNFLCIFFTLLAIGSGYIYFFNNKDIHEIVSEQLSALHHRDIQKAYYEFTSADYQEKISFPVFKRLVQDHPTLNQNQSVRFYEEDIQDDHAFLSAQLTGPNHQTAPILYQFVKAKGGWKISAMQLSEYGAHQNNARHTIIADAKDEHIASNDQIVPLILPIESQLKALREGRLDEAFDAFTSAEFKQTTSHDAFMDFIKEFPQLTHYTAVSFGPVILLDENKGKVQASVIYQDKSYPVDYVLMQENGLWKILSLRVQGATGDKIPVTPEEQLPLNQVIKDHLVRLSRGSFDTAYITHGSSQFKEVTSLDHYREFVLNYPEMTEYHHVDIDEAEERGGMHLVPVVFHTDKGESHFEFWLVNEKNNSKIWAVNIVDSAHFPAVSDEEKIILSEVITNQLEALKSGDVSKAYYGYGSDDFEKTTSFTAFKSFVNSYPILRSHTSFKIGEAIMEGELRLVKVELVSEKEHAELDYRLNKEGKNWKVWGVQIMTMPTETPPEHNEEAIKTLLINQLESINQGDLSKAYYAYTSKDFQESSSRDVFEKFINSQPVYGQNNQFQLGTVQFNADQAQAEIEMRAKNGEIKKVEFKFIYENDKWKIFALKIIKDLTPENVINALKEKRLKFDHVAIGNKVDLQGLVIDSKSEFASDAHEITANIFVQNGMTGTTIEVELEHLETGSKIPVVKTILKENGNSVATFIFSAPTGGWPVGNYKLRVNASTGQEASYSFKVNAIAIIKKE